MNYSKIINNTAFAALLATGAFAGFMIGVKLPSAFASLLLRTRDRGCASLGIASSNHQKPL